MIIVSNNGLVISYGKGIILGSTNGEFIRSTLGSVDRFMVGIDEVS